MQKIPTDDLLSMTRNSVIDRGDSVSVSSNKSTIKKLIKESSSSYSGMVDQIEKQKILNRKLGPRRKKSILDMFIMRNGLAPSKKSTSSSNDLKVKHKAATSTHSVRASPKLIRNNLAKLNLTSPRVPEIVM